MFEDKSSFTKSKLEKSCSFLASVFTEANQHFTSVWFWVRSMSIKSTTAFDHGSVFRTIFRHTVVDLQMLVVVIWIDFTFVETASDTCFECVSNLFLSEKQKVISKQMDHTNGTRTNFRYNGVDPIINSIGNNIRCCFDFVSE